MSKTGVVIACCCASLLAACGGDSGAGGGAADSSDRTTAGAKVIDVSAMDGAKGTVRYCTGKDTSGAQKESVKDFNRKFGDDGLKARLVEFPTSADEQRTQFIQRQQAKSADCDIFYSDVIWTAEFASQKWLYDLTPYVEQRRAEFIPSTLDTARYESRYWAVPKQTDAGFLYYRTDKVRRLPRTWQDVYDKARQTKGIVYQGARYEGLTVDFLEMAFAAGGDVLSPDGKHAVIDSPENRRALEFMAHGIESGAAPKAVATYKEEEARRAFESGHAAFMRNWPYAYALAKRSPIKHDFAVAPLPAFDGGGRAGVLGGHNLVISAFSKHPGAALKLIDFLTGTTMLEQDAVDYSLAPPTTKLYDDPDVKRALPFAAELRQAVQQARARPVSPVYPLISQAIYNNVYEALAGRVSAEAALSAAQDQIDAALRRF